MERTTYALHTTGTDQGLFLGTGVPLRNSVTDWKPKQILKANTKKKAFD